MPRDHITTSEKAACDALTPLLQQLGGYLDQYLEFNHPDAQTNTSTWQRELGGTLPENGIGAEQVIDLIGHHLIPNGSQIPKPGHTSYITTGATSIGTLTAFAGTVAAPQRFGLTAFHYLEELSLNWLQEMFGLSADMKGIYSSGGSVANLVAIGAARQQAFEKIGIDPSQQGAIKPCRIYASEACHHTIRRAAGVLGMGRASIVTIPTDAQGRMCAMSLKAQLDCDKRKDFLQVAIVANAGTTDTGAIDPLLRIGEMAREHGIWFHVDGAYGLPGILCDETSHLYNGLELADSVIVDSHKWLGAPVGIGATFVKDMDLLNRAFTQEEADYLEGTYSQDSKTTSMSDFGIPYHNLGVELSAPSRGAVVWALIQEIGKSGFKDRVTRHIDMARDLADDCEDHPDIELVVEPTLSIVCFRYVANGLDQDQLNQINKQIHQRLLKNGANMPSTTMIDGKLVLRPCFIGARTSHTQADDLLNEVLSIGKDLSQ